MRPAALLLSALAATSLAAPNREEKRQGDLTELLGLASWVGITALPTNPTALLQLGQAAAPLESALPTAPVLSVLETAAPKSFVSSILYNPAFASSFEAAFEAGSSPSWFNALPTDVKSYLHTYQGFPSLAAGAAALDAGLASVSATATATGASGVTSGATTGGSSAAAGSTMSMTTMTSSGTVATPTGGSSTSAAGAAGQSSATTSSAKTGGASRPDGAVAAGLAGVVGILGLALTL